MFTINAIIDNANAVNESARSNFICFLVGGLNRSLFINVDIILQSNIRKKTEILWMTMY